MMPKLNNSTSQPTAVNVTRIRQSWQRCGLGFALAITTTGLTGCTILGGLKQKIQHCDCVDDFMINHRNQVMATRAWFRVKHLYRGHCYLKDFRNGFIAGYMNVANGGAGCTPTIISPEYWGWRYQSGSGQAAVNAWYEGFPLGAKAAEEDGIGNYNLLRLNGTQRATSTPTNMTGSASPTPAMSPNPHSASVGLPPGVVLDEGETLVPGGVSIKDTGSGVANPNRNRTKQNVVPSPLENLEEIPPPARKELERTFEQQQPAEVKVDPFLNDLGQRSRSEISSESQPSTRESQFWNEITGGSPSYAANPPAPRAELELVPRDTTPVSTLPTKVAATVREKSPVAGIYNAPASGIEAPRASGVSEPSQAEIDAVIEEIFGKQPGGSR